MEIKKRKEKEKEGAKRCIDLMRQDGWKCHRLNVSAGEFSTTGYPDYYCTIECHNLLRKLREFNINWVDSECNKLLLNNTRWIEFKRSRSSSLEMSQIQRFRQFAEHNVGVWILRDENDYSLIYKEPNWWQWCL